MAKNFKKISIIIICIIFIISVNCENAIAIENTQESSEDPYKLLWKFEMDYGGCEIESIDMNGDGLDDVVDATRGPLVYVIDSFGELIWSYNTGEIVVEVLDVGDIDFDGKADVVLGAYTGVYAINNEGNLLWYYKTTIGPYSSPAIADVEIGDINGDGVNEIAVATYGTDLYPGYILIFYNNGSICWRYNLDDFATPVTQRLGTYNVAFADLDNDGTNEIVTSTIDHYIFAIESNGTLYWTYKMDGETIWRISAGDLNRDGADDVVAGSEWSTIYAIDGNGTLLWSNPMKPSCDALFTVDDLDRDGNNEVIIGSFDGYVYTINCMGEVIWKYYVGKEMETVVVGNMDADLELEIIAAPGSFNNFLIALESNGTFLWRYETEGWPYGLTMGDIDGDGNLEALASSFDHYVYAINHIPKIQANIYFKPNTLNLDSKGKWITCYIELSEGYDVRDIDANTILLEDSISPILDNKHGFVRSENSYIMDHDGDGVFERMVKFDRDEVEEILEPGLYNLRVTGKLTDGTLFEGYSDPIKAID
jgi:hypothetical protein